MKQTNFFKKRIRYFAVLFLTAFCGHVLHAQITHNMSSGTITLSNGADYIITGMNDGSATVIIPEGYQGTVTLRNLTITSSGASPIKVTGKNGRSNLDPLTKVNVILEGTNRLTANGAGSAAFQVDQGAQISISAVEPADNSSGTLTATSNSSGGAGIGTFNYANQGTATLSTGGSGTTAGGNIIISSGTVTAAGASHAAGIGGGWHSYYNGNIIIYGGVVTATNPSHGAGIGSGCPRGSGVVSEYAPESAIIVIPPAQILNTYGYGQPNNPNYTLAGTAALCYIGDPNKPAIDVYTKGAIKEQNANIYADLTETPSVANRMRQLNIPLDLAAVKFGNTGFSGTYRTYADVNEPVTFFTDASSTDPQTAGRPFMPVAATINRQQSVELPMLDANISFVVTPALALEAGYTAPQAETNAYLLKVIYNDSRPISGLRFDLQKETESQSDFTGLTFLDVNGNPRTAPTVLNNGDEFYIRVPIKTGKPVGIYQDVLRLEGTFQGQSTGYIRQVVTQPIVYNDTETNEYITVTADPQTFSVIHPTGKTVALTLGIRHTGINNVAYDANSVKAKYIITTRQKYADAVAETPISQWADLEVPGNSVTAVALAAPTGGSSVTNASFDGKESNTYYIHWYVESGLVMAHSTDVTSPVRENGGFGKYIIFPPKHIAYNGNENNGGDVPADPVNYQENDEATVLGNTGNLTKTGATFIGWSFNLLPVIMAATDVPVDLANAGNKFTIVTDTTLYAVWADDRKGPAGSSDNIADYLQFGVTYDGNEHTAGNVPEDQNLYNAGNTVTIRPKGNLVKDGAVFLGWSLLKAGLVTSAEEQTNAAIMAATFEITNDTMLYAVWAVDKNGGDGNSDDVPDYQQLDVTYNANGATGDAPVDDNIYSSGDEVTLKDQGGLTRDDAIFIGWNPVPVDLVTTQNAENDLTSMKQPDETFEITDAGKDWYAVWAEDANGPDGVSDGIADYKQLKTTYDGNGATGGAVEDGNLYNNGNEVTLKEKGNLTKTDYLFLGWNTSAVPGISGTSLTTAQEAALMSMKQPGETFVITGDTILYAFWAEDVNGPDGTGDGIPDYQQFDVTYHANGATGSVPDDNLYSGGTNLTLPAKGNLVRTGFTFLGWNPTAQTVTSADAERALTSMQQPDATFTIVQDTTWYAVWATDTDNNGIPDYNQVYLTFHKGFAPVASGIPDRLPVAKNSGIVIPDVSVQAAGYAFLGWSTNLNPLIRFVTTEAAITSAPTFYTAGESFAIGNNAVTLYAVWGIDSNRDGWPDYKQRPSSNNISARSGKMAPESSISLRSGAVPDYWNTDWDRTAFDDSVYYVGCTYNLDYEHEKRENHIMFTEENSFDGADARFHTSMRLVIEYGGVLTDGCMIGGVNQEPLDTLLIPNDPNFRSNDLFAHYPFTFDSIKEDGQAVLKMYFINLNDTDHPAITDFDMPATWGKPFMVDGEVCDTLTIKFNIYNKPEFESEIISQYVDPRGRIRLKHVSGTPEKYMMRSINGLDYKPASSPLSSMEQIAVDDGVSICLRELDRVVSLQADLVQYFLYSPRFIIADQGSTYFPPIYDEYESIVADSMYYTTWENNPIVDGVEYNAIDPSSIYNSPMNPFPTRGDGVRDYYRTLTTMFGMSSSDARIGALSMYATIFGHAADVYSATIAKIERDVWASVRQERADMANVGNSCRPLTHLAFERIQNPVVQRYVEIHTVAGVTANPGAGQRHHVPMHEDFTFTLTFPDGNPLKVIAAGTYSQQKVELEGTDIGGGMYRYVIRQVVEPWTVTVSTDPASGGVANEEITGKRVWTYANTLYIHSDRVARANIYTLAGMLIQQRAVPAGTVTVPLERGIYVVELDGVRYKVAVK
ncbi:MAG: InlB B-repeat-containing protein [Tannerella sp.]|jgi:hypothetical protein|nr:InlB B-repeat-containing protein [Tannerella sp.]